ncbi:YhgE/Pip domain-containing protein [Clostridium cibarium]|uniref:YhgE/Pip domain-containing protein n=1 Tax=Clostridium cibarium TaxID=2762247 RepID=A0ABR8PTQ4_9CLOT|nr:YhgE/Pip domain-containing protein [Clostridium cibarium]MBD7911499.1 YhgE/Pip domain-containing protein [Clostridium cibarium]
MNFLKIAGSDIKGIFKNRFIRVSVIAIIIVPLLYSLLYLDAFWDPYGRLKDMPVAVVNLDHGANLDGKFENYGNDFVDKLKDDNRVGWKFVSDEDASNGLEGNKYYAKLVITENFSKDIISAKEGAPKQADLRFVCNEKKNFLASQVNSKVESALKEEITKTVTETYVSGAFDNLYKVKDGMDAAADGSGQLNDGLNTANDGSNKLNDGQVQLNDGISTLNDKVPELASGANQLSNGASALQSGTSQLYDGFTNQIYPGVRDIDGGLKFMQSQLAEGKTELAEKSAAQLASIESQKTETLAQVQGYKDKYAAIRSGVDELIKGSTDTATNLATVEQLLKSGRTQDALKIVQGINSKVPESMKKASYFTKELEDNQKMVDSLDQKVTDQTDKIKDSALNSIGLINGKFTALDEGVAKLSKGSGDLKTGLTNTFGPGLEKANSGAGQLSEGLNTLNSKVPVLTSGVSKLYDGSNKLVSGQSDLKDGITKLHDGSNELATKLKDGSGELNDGLKNTSEDMGTFVATPVNLEVAPINPVPNYGTGFAPYFANLSLWIGAIMMFFVISAKTEQYEGASKFDKAFGKFLSFGFVGVLQAVLVGVVIMALGLAPGNIGLYFGSLIFFSLVYIAIVQCLISLFGDAGRLLSIVLLIMQLTACAGTFPLELVPKFFVVLNPFMPFTYSVEALREISSATVINYGVVGKDFLILAIVLIVFLATSIAGATFGEKMQRVIEGRKEGNN